MGKWFPTLYDLAMNPLENGLFKSIRQELANQATGRVLEVGAGTGINYPMYSNAVRVDAIEPSLAMIKKSESRHRLAKVPINIHTQSAEKLIFENETFDTVVATLVLCTIPNPKKAIEEIQRVTKPGGTLLFFEHVKMNHPFLAQLQETLTPFWKTICDGCHLNRDTLHLIKESGLVVKKEKSYYKGLFLVIECTKGDVE